MNLDVRLGLTERLMNATDLEPRRGESITAWRFRVGVDVQAVVADFVEERIAGLSQFLDEAQGLHEVSEQHLHTLVSVYGHVAEKAVRVQSRAVAELRRRATHVK